MDELLLVRSAQEGNQEAFRALFEENKKRVFTLAYKYLRNVEDAEDMMQETFIKAFNSIAKYEPLKSTNFTSWLCSIGAHSCIDLLRKQKVRVDMRAESLNDKISPSSTGNSNPEEETQVKEVQRKIRDTMERFPPKQKMIFILRHYQQLTTREIAQYLGCTEGNVKKQLFRAFSTMKESLKGFIPRRSYEVP